MPERNEPYAIFAAIAPASRRVLQRVFAALLLLALHADMGWAGTPRNAEDWGSLPRGWPVDEFALIDQHGKPFTQKQLLGRWTFILLGDAECGEPCATALGALTGLRQRIAASQKVKTTQVLFVSVSQESPAQLRAYLAPYDAHFIGAQGSPKIVA
jgi:cytochrome oxidase Cu insertion factor (SCO1/SenC/PrrC family)